MLFVLFGWGGQMSEPCCLSTVIFLFHKSQICGVFNFQLSYGQIVPAELGTPVSPLVWIWCRTLSIFTWWTEQGFDVCLWPKPTSPVRCVLWSSCSLMFFTEQLDFIQGEPWAHLHDAPVRFFLCKKSSTSCIVFLLLCVVLSHLSLRRDKMWESTSGMNTGDHQDLDK